MMDGSHALSALRSWVPFSDPAPVGPIDVLINGVTPALNCRVDRAGSVWQFIDDPQLGPGWLWKVNGTPTHWRATGGR